MTEDRIYDLEKQITSLNSKVLTLQGQMVRQQAHTHGALRAVMPSFGKYAEKGAAAAFYGKPVCHFDREELLATIGYLGERRDELNKAIQGAIDLL